MAHILDLPNEILGCILKELTYQNYGVELPVSDVLPYLTTCRRFYQLLLPNVYKICELNLEINGNKLECSRPKNENKDEVFGLYRKYGRFVKMLSITVRKVSAPEDPNDSFEEDISIPCTIQAFLPSFINLTIARFRGAPHVPMVLIFEGLRVMLTECLYLQRLDLSIDHNESFQWQRNNQQVTLCQLEAVDVSKPYARLRKLKLYCWGTEQSFPGSNRRFLETIAKIVDPSFSTVTDFELTGPMNYYDGFHVYKGYMPDRLWKVPATTSLSIGIYPDTICTLNQYVFLYRSRIRQLKLDSNWTSPLTVTQIISFASSFPNLEFLDLPNDKPAQRHTIIKLHEFLKTLKAYLPKLERVRVTVGSIESEDLKDMLGKEVVEGYKLTCGPHNLDAAIERGWMNAVTIYL